MKKYSVNFKQLFEIFLTFLKISPVSFGGGFAMIPIIEKEMVEKKKWIEREKIVDVFAVSQSVPGAIAVNSATYLGYNVAGVPGALAALAGIVTPTFVIVLVLAVLLSSFQHIVLIQAALKGIRPVVVALIAAAAFKMGKVSLIDKASWIIFISCVLVSMVFVKLNIIYVIIAGALAGILIEIVFKKIPDWNKENEKL